MACFRYVNDHNFIRWKKIVGTLTLDDIRANGIPDVCYLRTPTTPINLTALAVGGLNILLTWNDSNDNESGFELERDTNSSFTSPTTINIDANLEQYIDTVSGSGTYYYRIRAVVSNELVSDWSNTAIIEINAFTFEIDTTQSGSASDTFILPLVSSGTYDFYIDWGDGNIDNITTYNQSEVTHVYSSSGTYTCTILGTLIGWAFAAAGDIAKLTEISNWGVWAADTTVGCFQGCSNLDVTATDTPDISGTTSLESFFNGCSVMAYNSSINDWDVSHITNMRLLFQQCDAFNQDLNNWDTSLVTDMEQVFFGCAIFNGNIDNWNTSSVITFDEMFRFTGAFNRDISGWNVSSCQIFFRMFANCIFNQNIGSWTTTSATNMANMFDSNTVFNQNISSWNVANVTSMAGMFNGASSFNQNIGGWTTTSLQNTSIMFQSATVFNQNLGSWNVTSLTNATNMFNNITLSTTNYDALLVGWESQSVQNNVTFSGGNSTYTSAGAGGTARAALIADHTWTITDGGGV